MTPVQRLRSLAANLCEDIIVAFQFLTRIPMPATTYRADSLSRAVKFFPLVGLVTGAAAALLYRVLETHLARPLLALVILAFLVLITGCLHEDALADTFDAFGGGWSKEQILLILKDSRIGSYGATALVFSLLARYLLLASLPSTRITAYLISAHVLCRWTSLPLSYFLAPAREQEGQGSRIAQLTSLSSLLFGTFVSVAIVLFALHWSAAGPLAVTVLTVVLSAWIYSKKIGGITGDCFGATNQLTEIAVYCCGVWNA